MAAKRKLPVKRRIENLDDMASRIFESIKDVTSKPKRRRKENSEHSFENQDSINSQFMFYDNHMCDASQQKYARRQSETDQSKKNFSFGVSSNEKNLRSRVKKSYSLNKTESESKQIKSKRSFVFSNKTPIDISKYSECSTAVKSHKGREKKQVVSESIDTVQSMTDDIQVTKVKENNQQKHDTSQASDSNVLLKNEEESIISISPSFLQEENFSTSGSEISYVAVSCVSHSHNQILKPAITVTGIPASSSMTSLSASTSAITAISTPIPSFPVLHDGFGDSVRWEVDSSGHTTLTNWREDGSHTNMTSEQKEKLDFALDSAAERHEQQNVMSGSCNETVHHNHDVVSLKKNGDHSTSAAVPVVAVPFSSQQPSFLKVDTWGEYILQNLEILYKKEMYCDFILKFHGGEVLKVHRVILLTCTSLLSETDAMEGKSELLMPADLNFASVEPVIRFVYSGYLEIQKSDSEMTSVYAAAKRLKVPLLTNVMDCHFPSLFSPCLLSSATQGETDEHIKQEEEASPKSSSSSSLPNNDSTKRLRLEDCGGQKTSVYYVLKNSRRQSHSNSPVQSKMATEEARPTRFELEDDSENSPLKIATWDPKRSSIAPSCLPVAPQVSTPQSAYPCSSSTLVDCSISETCSLTTASSSHMITNSENLNEKKQPFLRYLLTRDNKNIESVESGNKGVELTSERKQPFLRYLPTHENKSVESVESGRKGKEITSERKQPFLRYLLTRRNKSVESVESGDKSVKLTNDLVVPDDNSKCVSETDVLENHCTKENDISEESNELMEKISNICKQLEEKESEDENEQLQKTKGMQKVCNKELCLLSADTGANGESSITKNSSTPTVSTPVKSILKKKKAVVGKQVKHVSFLLDQNNELINEVATFSLSKEPSQSLIGVKKVSGNLKSHRGTCSSVQRTVSKKKKALKSLSLSDSGALGSSSSLVKKSHSRKSPSTYGQSHSKSQVNKGDINSHAKIISEVLKKYPHLVKDKKKIRLKFLKKGNEKEAGEADFKVQYFMLGNNKNSKPKPLPETYNTLSITKNETSVPRAVKNQPTYECPECNNRTFTTYFMLKKHVTLEHKDKSSAILSRIENVPYACYTCFVEEPLEFEDYHSYQQHMKDVHNGVALRSCNICGIKLGQKLELAYHQYKEHNKVSKSFSFPKCDLCNHIAKNDSALLKHRSQHKNAENYTCSVCGVEFCSFGALQGHMQTKLCGTKPSVSHQCPFCPLTFTRSYNLKAHCKSNHRSQKISEINILVSGSEKKQTQIAIPQDTESQSEKTEGNDALRNKSNLDSERNNTDTGMECEAPTGRTSSEAESLSTVASSLVASLGLPEETMDQYVYLQANKMSHPNTLDEEKIKQVVSQSGGLAMHVEIPSASEYQSPSHCYDKPFSVQTSIPSNTSVGTLVPMMSSEVVASHFVSGQILPTHILSSGCMSSSSGPVHGAAPHSWTYVTYQVPTTNKDLPVVLTETTSINAHVNPDKNSSSENICQSRANVSTTESVGMSSWASENVGEELHTLSAIDNQTHVNINQAPPHSVTQCYDPLSSQYV